VWSIYSADLQALAVSSVTAAIEKRCRCAGPATFSSTLADVQSLNNDGVRWHDRQKLSRSGAGVARIRRSFQLRRRFAASSCYGGRFPIATMMTEMCQEDPEVLRLPKWQDAERDSASRGHPRTNSLASNLAAIAHVACLVRSQSSVSKVIPVPHTSWKSTATKTVVICRSYAFSERREFCDDELRCATGLRAA
jgi:hypothetical protein